MEVSSTELRECLGEMLRATVLANRYIPQEPTERQTEFVLTFDREVLYGGAAGGGKSSAVLMAALMFADVPGYSSLILRRTYADLALPGALMDRAADWLGRTPARWNGTEKRWSFPSGASLSFGYLESARDKYRYQSAEFQFIGVDELTQFEEEPYRYMFSRLRRLDQSPVPLRMRAGSNPGGVGHEWVKQRFLTGERRFVAARLDDNPHLDRADYVRSLAELDPITRAQLLAGDWDAYISGRFKAHWLRYFRKDRGFWRFDDWLYTPEQLSGFFLTVDNAATTPNKANKDPDYTVVSAWGRNPQGHLLWLGCVRDRIEAPDIPALMARLYRRYRAGKAYVGANGMEKGVVQLAKRYDMGKGARMNVIGVPATRNKLDSAVWAQNLAEAGRLWLPDDDPEFPLDDVKAEVLRFTGDEKKDAHDDICDSLFLAARMIAGGEHAKVTNGRRGGVVRKGLAINLRG